MIIFLMFFLFFSFQSLSLKRFLVNRKIWRLSLHLKLKGQFKNKETQLLKTKNKLKNQWKRLGKNIFFSLSEVIIVLFVLYFGGFLKLFFDILQMQKWKKDVMEREADISRLEWKQECCRGRKMVRKNSSTFFFFYFLVYISLYVLFLFKIFLSHFFSQSLHLRQLLAITNLRTKRPIGHKRNMRVSKEFSTNSK